MGDAFKKMGSSTAVRLLQPVELRKYSKLAAANLTGLLSQGQKQICSMPVFAGHRDRKLNDDFFKYMSEKVQGPSALMDNHSIEADLASTFTTVMSKVQKGQVQKVGNVKWFSTEECTFAKIGDGTQGNIIFSEEVIQESGQYFL